MTENNSESNHGPSDDGNRVNMDETLQPGVPISQISSIYRKKKESFLEQFLGENQVLAKMKA